ncbi:NRPS-like enzyme [Mycena venus]|uniref:NRPS-like enzyme n=1 Tax=Mycena venus TaxID=2733690 RepID=A0A8H7D2D6_9AGAR|nr:NRPS-like enzyme [Mycena venus]
MVKESLPSLSYTVCLQKFLNFIYRWFTGAGGTIHAYLHFEQEFKTNVWAIQVTPDTLKNSLYDQARFYFYKVKEQQPEGPYRLAAYSGTSMLVIPLAQMLQESGGTIIQLAFIDHFPTLLFCPAIGVQIKGNGPVDVGPATRRTFLFTSPTISGGAFNGNPNSEFIATFFDTMNVLLNNVFDFIMSLVETHGPTGVLDNLVGWIESVKAPITLYVASQGTVGDALPEYLDQWGDLGAKL